MGRIRYIGSKARIADEIVRAAGPAPGGGEGGRFVDLFSGTGVVTRAAAEAGWHVVGNDHLTCAMVMTAAQTTGVDDVPFEGFAGGYAGAVDALNGVEGGSGFITREYSPASMASVGFERRYFTEANAQRIDGMRAALLGWEREGRVTEAERLLLIGDLLEATSAVANIAGTYGCFLRKWTGASQQAVLVQTRELMPGSVRRELRVGDVFTAQCEPDDVAYLDPPYTKRQYASYYHVLETISLADEPTVEGVCGLRPWRHLASPFCYKVRALKAMCDLVGGLAAATVLISYSSEGHMNVDELCGALEALGEVRLHELGAIGRYRPNVTASQRGEQVVEFLIELRRPTTRAGAPLEAIEQATTAL